MCAQTDSESVVISVVAPHASGACGNGAPVVDESPTHHLYRELEMQLGVQLIVNLVPVNGVRYATPTLVNYDKRKGAEPGSDLLAINCTSRAPNGVLTLLLTAKATGVAELGFSRGKTEVDVRIGR